MIKARLCLSAVYFNGAVYVLTREEKTVEMLSLPNNQPGQWTLIFQKNPPPFCLSWSMCVFKKRFLVSGKLETIHPIYLSRYFTNIFNINSFSMQF